MVGETSTSAVKMNFNRILKIIFKEDNNFNIGYSDLVDFFESLNKYSPGNKNIPHEGFCDMEESNKIKFVIPKSDNSTFIDNDEFYSEMCVKNILCKTFRYETYFENKNEAQIIFNGLCY